MKKSNKSGFSMLAEGLNKAKLGQLKVSSQTEAVKNPDLFTKAEFGEKNDFSEKSEKLPGHSCAAGVHRGECVRLMADLTFTEARFGAFVCTPKYEKNPRTNRMDELSPPDDRYYMQIGYDRTPGEGTMHYRYVLKTPLETSRFMDGSPFDTFPIRRGQQSEMDSYFDLHSSPPKADTVGEFKGLIRIVKANEVEERRLKVENLKRERETVLKKLQSGGEALNSGLAVMMKALDEMAVAEADEEFDDIAKRLLTQTKVLVRVYILDAFGLAQKDANSQSDPYLRIKLGSKVWYNEKEHYQTDNPDPKIYKMFELETSLPGVSLLKIQFWDHDEVFSDEKIGQTIIDLEDRFFSNKWLSMKEKPIESRPLFSKTTKVPQGGVRLWLEIATVDQRASLNSRDISIRPPSEFEARLIIWGTEDVANHDDEGTSDIYIRAWINEEEPKETDTHYRCMNGKGSFNWRMVYPIILTESLKMNATIQIWDRDILSKNDFIAESTFSFNETAKTAWETNARVKRMGQITGVMTSTQSDKFWIDCMRRKKDGKMEQGGRVEVSLELVPKIQALACVVGEGRNDPNVDPFLPPPVGRFSWSWNPCKLIAQTVGPEYRIKACLFCCGALCLALCVFMFPMLMSNMITSALFSAV